MEAKTSKIRKRKSKQEIEPKTEYYYFVSDTEKQVGPVSLQKLRQETSELDIQKISVWYTGLSEWKPLSTIQAMRLLK